jgi:hypothetical protein
VKRLARILSAAATLLSLLFSLAVITLWIRSYSGTDYVYRRTLGGFDAHFITHHGLQLSCTRGQFRFTRSSDTLDVPRENPITGAPSAGPDWGTGRLGVAHVGWETPPPHSLWNRLGFFAYDSGIVTSFSDNNERVWTVPAWLPAIAFALLPAAAVTRGWRSRRRARAGFCARCGYDVRATPDRCPECGTIARS